MSLPNVRALIDRADAEQSREFEGFAVRSGVLILPHRFVPLSNVARVTAHKITAPLIAKLIVAGGGLLFLVIGLSLSYLFLLFTAGAGALLYYLSTLTRFGVRIRTNGETDDLLLTKTQGDADAIYAAILVAALEKRDMGMILVGGSPTLITGDVTQRFVGGDSYENIRDSVINNRSPGATA